MIIFDVLEQFNRLDEAEHSTIYGKGFINKTHFFRGVNHDFIIQMIDPNVYKYPQKAIDNALMLEEYMYAKENDDFCKCQSIVKTVNGEIYAKVKEYYWRCFDLRKGEGLFKKVVNVEMAYEMGVGLGDFHRKTKDFDVSKLHMTLQDIRNVRSITKLSVEKFDKDPFSYLLPVFNQYKYLGDRLDKILKIQNLLEEKKLPIRVTHKNLRLNNFIMNTRDYSFVALIGLDAIGPGTILYDFGQAAKHFTSMTREDDQFFENQGINLEYFTAFTKGYLKQVKDFITKEELDLLIDAVFAMTCNTALRHLLEYINIESNLELRYRDQNWDMVNNQIALAKDIEAKYENMKNKVYTILNE